MTPPFEIVWSLSLFTVALPAGAALLVSWSKCGTWRRRLQAIGLPIGLLVAYQVAFPALEHEGRAHPDAARSPHSVAVILVALSLALCALGGLFGGRVDRLLEHARGLKRSEASHARPRAASASAVVGFFGLWTGLVISSLTTGCFYSVLNANYARFPDCLSAYEGSFTFRFGVTCVITLSHWWIGARLGEAIDRRDAERSAERASASAHSPRG